MICAYRGFHLGLPPIVNSLLHSFRGSDRGVVHRSLPLYGLSWSTVEVDWIFLYRVEVGGTIAAALHISKPRHPWILLVRLLAPCAVGCGVIDTVSRSQYRKTGAYMITTETMG